MDASAQTTKTGAELEYGLTARRRVLPFIVDSGSDDVRREQLQIPPRYVFLHDSVDYCCQQPTSKSK